MDPHTTVEPPPEARLIKVAREATGMTAADAAKATNGILSAAYWRDIERGYGGRRGVRVPTRASARVLAHMARTVRVNPARLAGEGQREDAAAILREILTEPSAPRLAPVPVPVPGSEAEAKARFVDLFGTVDPRDVELLQVIARALDNEGNPMPWSKKFGIADKYLREFAEHPESGTGTALPPRHPPVAFPTHAHNL